MSKLTLKTETLHTLTSAELDGVAGGLGHIKNPFETDAGHRKHKHHGKSLSPKHVLPPDGHVSSERLF